MKNIRKIILITPENRSFHHIFGCFEKNHSNHYCYRADGSKIYCGEIDPVDGGDGIQHDISNNLTSIKGLNNEPMTGFILAGLKNIRNLLTCDGIKNIINEEQIMGI